MTYADDDIVKIEKANPQGINENILVLNLTIIEGNEPMKGSPKPFQHILSDESAKKYTQVTVRYSKEASITENIEVFG